MNIKPITGCIALITNQCNCACPYCFEERRPERMTLDVAKDILNFLSVNARGGRCNFTFFGGEPMLEFDRLMVPLVEYAKIQNIRVRFGMTTNGTLLDSERLEWLSQNGIQFMLSFDGQKKTQETSRPMPAGTSSYEMIMANWDLILAKYPNQCVRATLIKENVGRFFDDICFMESHGVRDFSVLPNFFDNWDAHTQKLFMDQLEMYNRHIITSYRSGKKPMLLRAYRAAFYEIPKTVKMKSRRTSGNCLPQNQCGFGIRGGASIDYQGDIYGCHHDKMTHDSPFWIGSIYTGVDEKRVEALMDNYDPLKVGNEKCATCPIDAICNGGCVSNNYVLCGDVHKVHPSWCFWRQSIITMAEQVIQTLGKEANPLFLEDFKGCLDGRAVYA